MIYPCFNRFCSYIFSGLIVISINFILIMPSMANETCTQPDDAHIAPYVGTWHGTLGDQPIVLHLEPHHEDIQRVQGYYILEENPTHHILFVGEQINHFFEGEESANGADISGLWELTFPSETPSLNQCYLTMHGEWIDHNFENPKPILLRRAYSSW